MRASQISTLINEIYAGVERSNLGKIIDDVVISEKYPEGKRINHLPYQTFLAILQAIVPKNISGSVSVGEKQ